MFLNTMSQNGILGVALSVEYAPIDPPIFNIHIGINIGSKRYLDNMITPSGAIAFIRSPKPTHPKMASNAALDQKNRHSYITGTGVPHDQRVAANIGFT